MKAEKVKVILNGRNFYDSKPADFVAQERPLEAKGGSRAALSIGQEDYAKDYISLIDGLINRLVEAVK